MAPLLIIILVLFTLTPGAAIIWIPIIGGLLFIMLTDKGGM